jgi:hypothetical protein
MTLDLESRAEVRTRASPRPSRLVTLGLATTTLLAGVTVGALIKLKPRTAVD